MLILALGGIATPLAAAGAAVAVPYPWQAAAPTRTLGEAIVPPRDAEPARVAPGSFGAWLRGLPVKPAGTPVRLYDGRPKWDQTRHAAVIDIDTGKRDLQQCADAIMRLRAEWLFAQGRAIAFNDSKGRRMRFAGGGRAQLQRYLTRVFSYAGSYSLERELRPVALADIAPGDVFIAGGFPGHAMLVTDVVRRGSETQFTLMQSYMPAQDMHIVVNPKAPRRGDPWFVAGAGAQLVTPDWLFAWNTLRRFPE